MKTNNQFDINTLPTLNFKELEHIILKQLSNSGKSCKEISKIIGTSERTVFRYLRSYEIIPIEDFNIMVTKLKRAGYKIIKK